MGQLCIYLTPFASDYSGVCSALFELDCMTAICDASCCTSHYVHYDEPRWEKKVRPVFSTAIRTIDAVLGNDDKLIEDICKATEVVDTTMISLIGTPVPAITGIDMDGIAEEIEYRTGKPSFGFNTTGFDYYDKGIVLAGKALIDRFSESKEVVPGTVNILGMTPLDFGDKGTDSALTDFLTEKGWKVNCSLFMNMETEDIAEIGAAEVNLAVSAAGLALAKYLKKKYKTPYVAGFPAGEKQSRLLLERLEKAAGRKEEEYPSGIISGEGGKRLLIVGDQVISNSIREALRCGGSECGIDVAGFFGWDRELAEEGDVSLTDEVSFIKLIKDVSYYAIIGDPDLFMIPQLSDAVKIGLVHPAVSGKRRWEECVQMTGFADEIIRQINGRK